MSVIKNVIFGVVLTSVCIIVFSGLISDLAKNTNLLEDNNTMNITYNKIQQMSNITEQMSNEINNAKLESSSIWVVVSEAPFKTLKLVSSSIEIMFSMVGSLLADLTGMPSWLGTVISVFITITLVVVVLGAFLRWRT